MIKLFFSLIILIAFTSCDPIGTYYCFVTNHTSSKIIIVGDFQYNDTIINVQDSIFEINPNTTIEILQMGGWGTGTLYDSISFIERITIGDSIYCKKNWKDVKTWVKINKSKHVNEYTLNLYDSDF